MRMPVTICGSMIAITVSMAAFNHPCRITLPASMSRNPLSVVGQGLCRPASPSGPRRRGRRRSDLDSPDEDETDRPPRAIAGVVANPVTDRIDSNGLRHNGLQQRRQVVGVDADDAALPDAVCAQFAGRDQPPDLA
jgi:hypothetical protein